MAARTGGSDGGIFGGDPAGRAESGILDLLRCLTRLAPAGFATALHVRYQTPTYLFQTYPAPWREEYSREGLVMSDPIVAWAFGEAGVTTWAALEPRDHAGVFARARRHGLAHGLALSLNRAGSRSFAGVARGDRAFTAAETDAVVATVEALHDRTAEALPLSPTLHLAIRRMSVAFTQA